MDTNGEMSTNTMTNSLPKHCMSYELCVVEMTQNDIMRLEADHTPQSSWVILMADVKRIFFNGCAGGTGRLVLT